MLIPTVPLSGLHYLKKKSHHITLHQKRQGVMLWTRTRTCTNACSILVQGKIGDVKDVPLKPNWSYKLLSYVKEDCGKKTTSKKTQTVTHQNPIQTHSLKSWSEDIHCSELWVVKSPSECCVDIVRVFKRVLQHTGEHSGHECTHGLIPS